MRSFILPTVFCVLLSSPSTSLANKAAKIAVHLQAHQSKNQCTTYATFPPCNPDTSYLVTEGQLQTSYDIYVYVMDGDSETGVAGVTFGIDYNGAATQGVNVLSWTSCANLEFTGAPSGSSWPDAGSGAVITWDKDTNCQDTSAPGDTDSGVTALIGVLYVYAYGNDVFEITAREYTSNPDFNVVDCSAVATELSWPGAAGSIAFGTGLGVDPCEEQGESQSSQMWEEDGQGGFVLDKEVLDSVLKNAPLEFNSNAKNRPILMLPAPSGEFNTFEVEETSIFSSKFRSDLSEIGTYKLVGRTNSFQRGRMTVTPSGMSVRLMGGGSLYEVANRSGSYKPVPIGLRRVNCSLDSNTKQGRAAGLSPLSITLCERISAGLPSSRLGHDNYPIMETLAFADTIYQYDVAVNATGEFTSYYGSVAAAESAIVAIVNEINAIYEVEFGISLTLALMNAFADPQSDPYSAKGNFTSENQAVTDSISSSTSIGYDVGILFDYDASDSDGVFLGLACEDQTKASAFVVYHDPASVIYMYYAAHEIGHAFSARHTSNALDNSVVQLCGAELWWEPASGSTVMSYAGITNPSNCNIGPTNDAYFHTRNIEQVYAYTRLGNGSCSSKIPINNGAPNISSSSDFIIPRDTPFTLSTSATDPDGDSLTYCWEQVDPNCPTDSWPTRGPLFRSYVPVSQGTRTFPSFLTILQGPPTSILDVFELLPNVDRDMTFRVSVRDGNGGIAYASSEIKVRGNPFSIIYPNGGESLTYGDALIVTWNTGLIDSTGTTEVNIYLMLDDDEAQQYPLMKNVPNTGIDTLIVPNIGTNAGRLVLKARNSVYFDMSDATFEIEGTQIGVPDISEAVDLWFSQNPTVVDVSVKFSVPSSAVGTTATISIIDINGRVVKTYNYFMVTEVGSIMWDRRNQVGAPVASGIYFVLMHVNSYEYRVRKVVLLR